MKGKDFDFSFAAAFGGDKGFTFSKHVPEEQFCLLEEGGQTPIGRYKARIELEPY